MQTYIMKPISRLRTQKLYLILMLLPVAAFFRDVIILDIGIFFLTTVKVSLLIAGLLLLKYCHVEHLIRNNSVLNLVSLFALHNVTIIASIFYSPHLSMSQIINYSFVNFFSLIIVICCSKLMVEENYVYALKKFMTVLTSLFFIELIISIFQAITGKGLIRNVGIIPANIGYAVSGFHYERLFMCEFLIIGLAVILLRKRFSYFIEIFLTICVVAVIYLSDSFTGRIALLSLLFVFKKINAKIIFLLIFLIITVSMGILPFLNKHFINPSEHILRNQKIQKYFTGHGQENFRVVTTLALIKNFINAPTIIGHGYKENEHYLGSIMHEIYPSAKSKNISSHTFISILYDQGTFGFIIFIFMCLSIFVCSFKVYRKSKKVEDDSIFIMSRLSLIFTFLMSLRFLLYYHAIHHWHFLMSFILLNSSLVLLRKNQHHKTKLT